MSNYIDSVKTATLYFYNIICAYNCVSIVSSSEPLIGSQDVLLVYTCSGVRPSVRRPFSSVKLLRQAKPNFIWSIPGKDVNKSLYKRSRSHDQDGRNASI